MPADTLTKADLRRLEAKIVRIQRRLDDPNLTQTECDRLEQRLLAIQEKLTSAR